MPKLEPRYTAEEVAERYRVALSTVHRWIRLGHLGALDLITEEGNHRYAIRPGDLEDFERVRATIRPGRKSAV